MTFLALDDKSECFGYYTQGELVFHEGLPENLDRTWDYLPFLHGKGVQYARLYCDGKSYAEVCPESLKPEWDIVVEKLKAYSRSFDLAKININEVCFYDLLPEQFLKEFCEAKCKIIDHVFDTYPKPIDYGFRLQLEILLKEIAEQTVQIDKSALKDRLSELRVRNFLKKIEGVSKHVCYNQFGTKTGRLTTKPNTIPVLNMDKDFRSIFKPHNGWYLELDYNAAELRTLIALSGLEQPDNDIHEWNRELVGGSSREQVKQEFFAWLYGSKQVDGSAFEKVYRTDKVKNHYWNGTMVRNRFGREIEADEHHALNYIVQSTASDLVLRQTLKVHDLLQGKKSRIAFLIHDSIIIDLSLDDKDLIKEMANTFGDTIFGEFKTTVRIGKTLNNTKKVEV